MRPNDVIIFVAFALASAMITEFTSEAKAGGNRMGSPGC
jgi:hypothetical protein